MIISELIAELEELKDKHGDIEVKRKNYCGDYGETENFIYCISYKKDSYGDEWVK